MNFIRFFIIISILIAVIINDLSFTVILLLIVNALLLCVFTVRHPLNRNYAKYMVLFIIWISVIFMPGLHLVAPIMEGYEEVTPKWDAELLNFGAPLSCIVSFIMIMLAAKQKNSKIDKINPHPKTINRSWIEILTVISILLSLFSYATGLGRMGGEQIQLPFHLSGIINIYRWTLFPMLFAVFVENQLFLGKKIPSRIYLLFFVWCIVEIFAWMSKSVFIYHILPLVGILFLCYKPSWKKVQKYVLIVLVPFILLYPIIEIMRASDSRESIADSFTSAREQAKEESVNNQLLKPINRTFMFGAQFVQNNSYINTNQLFDFKNVPLLVLSGGAAGFQTFVIDQYPDGAIHSSGSSGLMDPLLHGGIGFMYIVVVLLCLVAAFVDKLLIEGVYSIAVILILRLFDWTAMLNVSSLYDSSGLQTLLVELLCIFIAYRINFKSNSRSLVTQELTT